MKYLTSIGNGALTIFLSSFTAYQLSHENLTCYILLGTALILLVLGIGFWKSDKVYSVCLFIAFGGILSFSIYGLYIIEQQKDDHVVWQEYLADLKDPELERLKTLADNDDGPSQYELANYYFNSHNYIKSREYAQKAADNGNVNGYILLVRFYLNGIGCNKDIHQAVSNMIKAQRADYKDFTPLWMEIKEQLTEDERSSLVESRETQKHLEALSKDVFSTLISKGEDAARKVIGSYYHELSLYSKMGYIPATEYIYLEECYRSDRDSSKLKELTDKLYRADHIPSNPPERAAFFGFLRGKEYYDDRDFQQHIQDRNFAFIFPDIDKRSSQENRWDYSKASDEHLIRDYQLFKAQYEEMKKYANGEIESKDYVFSLACDHNSNYRLAKVLLKSVIDEIQSRKYSAGMTEIDTTKNYSISHSIRLSMTNPNKH